MQYRVGVAPSPDHRRPVSLIVADADEVATGEWQPLNGWDISRVQALQLAWRLICHAVLAGRRERQDCR